MKNRNNPLNLLETRTIEEIRQYIVDNEEAISSFKNGRTLLECASFFNREDVVNLVFNEYKNYIEHDNITKSLFFCVNEKNKNIIKILLEKGAELEDEKGEIRGRYLKSVEMFNAVLEIEKDKKDRDKLLAEAWSDSPVEICEMIIDNLIISRETIHKYFKKAKEILGEEEFNKRVEEFNRNSLISPKPEETKEQAIC